MIDARDLSRHYTVAQPLSDALRGRPKSVIRAVDGISFSVAGGEVLGLVGESGCGKSTLARLLVGLEPPTGGGVSFDGDAATDLIEADRRGFHARVQMVFQDPYGSLNPQQKVGEIVTRPLIYQRRKLSRAEMRSHAETALEEAGLSPVADYFDKFPHQLSGGQRQRVCIARAIVLGPDLLVADEPVSMLDVSIKWGIIQLLKSLVQRRNLAMVYITHDLSSAGSVCDKLAVMYLGRIVECGPTDQIVENPQHPYTRALLAATPSIDPEFKRDAASISGSIPDATNLPGGCRFHPRCPLAQPICRERAPDSAARGGHSAECHFAFDAMGAT